jgi:hypothetical protein
MDLHSYLSLPEGTACAEMNSNIFLDVKGTSHIPLHREWDFLRDVFLL